MKNSIAKEKLKRKFNIFKRKMYQPYISEKIEIIDFLYQIIDFDRILLKDKTNFEKINEKIFQIKKQFKKERNNEKLKQIFVETNKVFAEFLEIIEPQNLLPTKNKDLREYQLKTVDYFQEITEIFDKNNMKYFLLGGTLIGALRHNGFIPWDDDIDIGMMREDYEKLKQYLTENGIAIDVSKLYFSKANFYKIVNNTLKKNPNKLVYMLGPKYIQIYKGRSIKKCFYVDIFPHEYYKDDYTMEEYNKVVSKINRKYIEMDNFKKVYEMFKDEIKNNKNIVKKSNKIYYSIDSFVTYSIPHKTFMTEDMIFPLKKILFENKEFYIPNKPEEYINIEYPNYNGMPSEISIAPNLKSMLNF